MASSKPAVPEPTEIAGRYIVEKKLGAGAFGTVYKAKDKVLKRMVAIKTIRLEGLAAQGAGLEEMLQRFQREAEVSAQLRHPNIVTIHDLGNAEGLSYLAMEFIDGVGLEKVIAQAGRLPVERAASLGAQVADALGFAHKNGVVHRDIKPANIMVEAGDRVKVTDFGIARLTESAEHLTMTGSLLGTPSYMSPEQARGGEIDGRSDLFSLGCVLYEMLAGRKAFRGESITALIFKIITEPPPPLRELAPDVPEAMLRVVEKAMAKAPEARYQTGNELAEDLRALTRAGHVPTLRQAETPTVPAQAAAATPTVAIPRTVSEPPTQRDVATRVAAATTPPAARRPPAPAVPPPPLPRTPPVARPAAPPPVARKSGGGAGLLIGIGAVGLFFVALVVVAGWFLFLRRPAERPTAIAEDTLPPSTAPAATLPPASLAPPPTSLAAEPPVTVPPPTAAPATLAATTAPSTLAPKPPPRSDSHPAPSRAQEQPPMEAEPGAGGNVFLDTEPPEVDGVEAGARVAEGFRGGGGRSSGFGASRNYPARPLSPRPQRPVEQPAIFTLRYIMNAERKFSREKGRYGALPELVRSGILPLAGVSGDGFVRGGYRFEVEARGDSFRVTARPLGPGRSFVGDESNYIDVDE
jgi:serine/threonine-protein kinase